MKLLGAFLFFAGVLAGRLDAGTGTGTSGNSTVDTTVAAGNVTVSMHRANFAVLANADANAGAHDRLLVKAAAAVELASQPPLPAWDYVSGSGGGLVADGVTPLIFRIAAGGTPSAGGDRYEVTVAGKWEPIILPYPGPLLSRPGSTVVPPRLEVTLTRDEPVAFVVLNAIRSEDLIASGYAGPVVARIDVRDSETGNPKSGLDFGISRPPVVLVHGYNADAGTWGTGFRSVLAQGRGPNLVHRINYGTVNENWLNTFGSLNRLPGVLEAELRSAIEDLDTAFPQLRNWAFTRYDAVGHSQGGVLLRLLCSSQLTVPVGGSTEITAFQPFRNAANHYRGRFRRLVTIGSPHAGSTLAHLAIRMEDEGVEFGWPLNLLSREDRQKLLQPKFMIDDPATPDRYQTVQTLNKRYVCDPAARIHMLCATINGGLAPSASGGGPGIYDNLYLNTADSTGGQRWAEWIAPLDSDGVVDIRSQSASQSGPGAANSSRIAVANKIAHADDGVGIYDLFGTDETEAASTIVAEKVVNLLDGSAAAFSPFSIPPALHQQMNDTAATIENIVMRLAARQQRVIESMLVGPIFAPPPPPDSPPSATMVEDQVLTFSLDPPAGETLNGMAEWSAVVYGPQGVGMAGLSLAATGPFGENLSMTVAGTVVGQVVLSVRFLSTSGKTLIGAPVVVLERPPGTALTGIACSPATINGQVGAESSLEVRGIYDGLVTMPIFTSPANAVFQSSNSAVATVDSRGRVKLVALGTATISATYNGTFTATCAVTVLDDPPTVVNPPTIPATVGQPLTFQLSASQVVQTFAMDALPAGLTLDVQSGLIEGVPAAEGRFPAVVTVQNANGTGSKQMEFVIAGVPGAPTDVGVDAAGVNGGKPVGTVVGRLVTVDPNPLDTFTYQLVSGAGGTDNGLFTIAGDSLVTAAVLNGAATSTVSIRVRTTDSSGASFEKALVLPVGTPPAIVRQPDARTVFAGESAIFFVETTGLEPLQYQWKKDGVDVVGATSRIFEASAAALGDAGNYTVAVSNGDGSVTSAAASLVVDPISYGRWASVLPSGMASALFEPGADYDADGIVNFLDFAFGVQPGLESGVGAQPFVYRDAFGHVLAYREANGIAPLVYRILKSVDLGAWVEHVPALGEVTRTNLGAFTQVQVRVPAPNPGVFFKVEVAGP